MLRVAALEAVYSELLAAIPRPLAAPTLMQRYEQNLRNLLPSRRRSREPADGSEAPTAAEPPTMRQRIQ